MNRYAQTDTDRRLANVVQIGRILAIDPAKGLARVDLDGPATDWMPWTTARAGGDRTWWCPEIGEQVVVAAVGGDLGNGVIVGCLYQDAYPEPADQVDTHRTVYADGTVIEYDRASHRLLADLGASAIKADRTEVLLQVGGVKIAITSNGVAITGNLTIKGVSGAATVAMDGNVAITGSALTHNGKNIGGTHAHLGIMPGPGTSGPPA